MAKLSQALPLLLGLSLFSGCPVGTPPAPSTVEGDSALLSCLSQWEGKLSDPSLRKAAISALAEGLPRISDPTKREQAQKEAAEALIEAYQVNANREEILQVLKETRRVEALPTFRAVIKDFEPGKTDRLVAIAADALGEMQDPQAVDVLIPLLKAENPYLKMKAVRALGSIQDPDKKARQALEELLKAPDSQERFVTVLAIMGLGNLRDPRSVLSLVRVLYLRQGDRDLAPWVILALTQLGDSAVNTLLDALTGKLEDVKKLEKDRVIPPGRRGYLAARALAEIPLSPPSEQKVQAALREALADDKGPEPPREGAAYALGLLGEAKTAESLARYLGEGYATHRIAVARGLAMLGNPSVLPALLKMMKEGEHKDGSRIYHHPRWEAARAVALLGKESTLAAYDEIREKEKDSESKKYFDEYRVGLLAAKECKESVECWKKKLFDENWMVREKAAYVLAHARAKEAARDLIRAYQETENYEARRAFLFALKRTGQGALGKDDLDALLAFSRKEESDPEKRKPYAEIIEEPVPAGPDETPKPPIKKFKPKQAEHISGDPITLSDLAWEVRLVVARLDPNYIFDLPRDWEW